MRKLPTQVIRIRIAIYGQMSSGELRDEHGYYNSRQRWICTNPAFYCRDFLKGYCRWGSKCRYDHQQPPEGVVPKTGDEYNEQQYLRSVGTKKKRGKRSGRRVQEATKRQAEDEETDCGSQQGGDAPVGTAASSGDLQASVLAALSAVSSSSRFSVFGRVPPEGVPQDIDSNLKPTGSSAKSAADSSRPLGDISTPVLDSIVDDLQEEGLEEEEDDFDEDPPVTEPLEKRPKVTRIIFGQRRQYPGCEDKDVNEALGSPPWRPTLRAAEARPSVPLPSRPPPNQGYPTDLSGRPTYRDPVKTEQDKRRYEAEGHKTFVPLSQSTTYTSYAEARFVQGISESVGEDLWQQSSYGRVPATGPPPSTLR